MFVGLNCSVTQLVTICVTVFLTDVLDCYALIADGVCFYCFAPFPFLCYVLYCTIGMV